MRAVMLVLIGLLPGIAAAGPTTQSPQELTGGSLLGMSPLARAAYIKGAWDGLRLGVIGDCRWA